MLCLFASKFSFISILDSRNLFTSLAIHHPSKFPAWGESKNRWKAGPHPSPPPAIEAESGQVPLPPRWCWVCKGKRPRGSHPDLWIHRPWSSQSVSGWCQQQNRNSVVVQRASCCGPRASPEVLPQLWLSARGRPASPGLSWFLSLVLRLSPSFLWATWSFSKQFLFCLTICVCVLEIVWNSWHSFLLHCSYCHFLTIPQLPFWCFRHPRVMTKRSLRNATFA